MRRLPVLAMLSLPHLASAHPDAAITKRNGDLIAAIHERDVAGVKRHVQLPLLVHNLQFQTPACAKFKGKEVRVEEAELAPLVTCLATLDIQHLPGPDDIYVHAVYGPGIPLVLGGSTGPVKMLLSLAKPDAPETNIEPTTFAAHVTAFTREVAPAPAIKAALARSATDYVEAQVTVCVDARGAVRDAKASASDPAYEADAVAAVRRWRVKPFVFGGKAVPACTRLSVGYPAARLTTPLQIVIKPPPPPPATDAETVGIAQLEANRIAGDKNIMPDDQTKDAIRKAGVDKVIGMYKLCIDDKGVPSKVQPLKQTGFIPYDAKLARELNAWRYRPIVRDGKAVPVCAAVTFIYATH